MCTNNLLAFVFSILPIIVLPEYLSSCIFAFKKRKYTRQNSLSQGMFILCSQESCRLPGISYWPTQRTKKFSLLYTTYLVLFPDLQACCLLSEKKLSLYCCPVWKQLRTHFNHHNLKFDRTFFRN